MSYVAITLRFLIDVSDRIDTRLKDIATCKLIEPKIIALSVLY